MEIVKLNSEHLHEQLLELGTKFHKLPKEARYEDCYCHLYYKKLTVQGTIAMQVKSLFNPGKKKFLYLCEGCFHKCVWFDGSQLRFSPERV